MKFLAIDYGIKRIGIAVSDYNGSFAFPLCTLHRRTKVQFFDELLQIIAKEQAEGIVVGLPLYTDGTECLTTKQVRNFVASLKRRTSLPVFWMNEILSSSDAETELTEMGVHARRIKQIIDQQAAVLILETFLNVPEKGRILA